MYVVLAVFAIYAFLPSVALSALPVQPATQQMVDDSSDPIYDCPKQVHLGQPTSPLACRYAGDPVAGLVEQPRPARARSASGLGYYVRSWRRRS